MQTATTVLLWFCAISCGLLGGLYFAFSAFIMSAFNRAALAIIGLFASSPAGFLLLAGGVIYVFGMFGVTMLWNVPLNNALAAAEGTPEAAATWSIYYRQWTRWNHVRTVTSTAAAALFIAALP